MHGTVSLKFKKEISGKAPETVGEGKAANERI